MITVSFHYYPGDGHSPPNAEEFQYIDNILLHMHKINIDISYIMKFKNLLKTIKPAEIIVLVIFVLYVIFPVPTPSLMSPYIESPLGLLVLFCIAVALFVYSNPAVGILFIFVAYTLLRRSATVKNETHYVQYTNPCGQCSGCS